MGKPSATDPLGLRPDPADFGDMINDLIDRRIEQRLTGRTHTVFDGCRDIDLVQELLARGWAVYWPGVGGTEA